MMIAIGIAIGIESTRKKFDSDPDTDPDPDHEREEQYCRDSGPSRIPVNANPRNGRVDLFTPVGIHARSNLSDSRSRAGASARVLLRIPFVDGLLHHHLERALLM